MKSFIFSISYSFFFILGFFFLIFLGPLTTPEANALIPFKTRPIVENFHTDTLNDVDHNITSFCQDLQTDIINTSFSRIDDLFIVKIQVSNVIQTNNRFGYREYYFWIGNPSNQTGYQPYLPYSIAWPDLFADYRVFFSLNKDIKRVALQNCQTSDCSQDNGLSITPEISVTIEADTIVFKIPAYLLPEIESLSRWKVGFTTYYSYGQCSGEDDCPNWNKNAFLFTAKNRKIKQILR